MISKIHIRRARMMTPRTSPDCVAPPCRSASQTGMTMWLLTIVLSASVATMTIDVADENPPRKDRVASPFWFWLSGRLRTNRSGFDPAGNRSSPTTAMGTTNRLINIT